MSDLSKLYDDIIASNEMLALLNRIGGKINSSPLQRKRSTIQIQDSKTHRWLLFANGYVRESNLIVDWRPTVVAKTKDFKPTLKNMISQIDLINNRLDKRAKTLEARKKKLIKYGRQIVGMLFDPQDWGFYTHGSYLNFRGWNLNSESLINNIYFTVSDKTKVYEKKNK